MIQGMILLNCSEIGPPKKSYVIRKKGADHRGSTGPAEPLLRTRPLQIWLLTLS